MNDAVSNFMTPKPVTIGVKATLATARVRMNEHGVRHLPVMHGAELVGLLSQRDIQLIESLKDVNVTEARVDEAMTQDVLVVTPDTALAEVAKQMAQRKCGSAVVMHGRELKGIFTTFDALRAIESLLNKDQVLKAIHLLPDS